MPVLQSLLLSVACFVRLPIVDLRGIQFIAGSRFINHSNAKPHRRSILLEQLASSSWPRCLSGHGKGEFIRTAGGVTGMKRR